jgi:glyoxylase-like metal-dependent hydrolase (beta-lactamase superfamily II)
VELYLVEGDYLTLIDTGCADSPEHFIAPALEDRGLALKDIQLVINTHGHFDHAGGNAKVVAESGCEVWLPARDARVASDPDLQFDEFYLQDFQLTERAPMAESAKSDWKRFCAPSPVNRQLHEGELINIGRGIELRVISTPGHTLGSVCFYWEREGLLFTGDSVGGGGSRPGGLPLIYYPLDYNRSLDLLEKLDINILCLGHHYVSFSLARESVKFGRLGKQFIQQSRDVARLISAAVEVAAAEEPDGSFFSVARSAVSGIRERLPLRLSAETGLPLDGATSALYSNWLHCKGVTSEFSTGA